MAVTQISRVQHRRGLQQDLPQLASAELGWSIDTRRLYIGNGTLDEGAPTVGVTRILTEHDVPSIAQFNGTYTFVGNVAGYVAQTGINALNPTLRSYQSKLDDFVNIKDFGALGDGTTDDTNAINRALQQVYKAGTNESQPLTRRTIYFPGGRYKLTDTILIPPNTRILGDGSNSAIIVQSFGNKILANICDSKFQTGSAIGSNSASIPQNIEISSIQFQNSNVTVTQPLVQIDSASNVKIQNTNFVGNSGVANCVNIISTVQGSRTITFDTCTFLNAGNALSMVGSEVTAIRVTNSVFDQISNVAVNLHDSIGFCSIGNFFGNVGRGILSNGLNFNFALGDSYYGNLITNLENVGLALGNVLVSSTHYKQLDTNTTAAVGPLLANTSMAINYEIKTTTSRRFGTFNYFSNSSAYIIDDNYNETSVPTNVTLTANATHLIGYTASGSADLTLYFTQFN